MICLSFPALSANVCTIGLLSHPHTKLLDLDPSSLCTLPNLWFRTEFYGITRFRTVSLSCNFFRGMFIFFRIQICMETRQSAIDYYRRFLNPISIRSKLALRAIKITIFEERTLQTSQLLHFPWSAVQFFDKFPIFPSVEWRAWNIAYRTARHLPDGPPLFQIQYRLRLST